MHPTIKLSALSKHKYAGDVTQEHSQTMWIAMGEKV